MIRSRNKWMKLMAIILPILLATICLIKVIKNDNQAGTYRDAGFWFSDRLCLRRPFSALPH